MAWAKNGNHRSYGREGKHLLAAAALLQLLASLLTDCFHASLVFPCKYIVIYAAATGSGGITRIVQNL